MIFLEEDSLRTHCCQTHDEPILRGDVEPLSLRQKEKVY